MTNVTQTKFKKFVWYNLTDSGEEEISFLRDNFDFSAIHLRDCAAPPLRPKIESHVIPAKSLSSTRSGAGIQNNEYIFIILLFPIFNRQTRLISASELDIFLGRDFLVTVHKNDILALRDFSERVERHASEPARWRDASPLKLLLDILEEMTGSLYPMLNHVAWDIDELDKQLFAGQERALLNSILTIKRNIVDIRKAVRSHSHVFSQLAELSTPLSLQEPAPHLMRGRGWGEGRKGMVLDPAFAKLISQSNDIWEQLENHKATIDAIQETNESLISFQISSVMKTLTIFSVIIFPLTLIAAIFGMDARGGMPFVDSPYGFWKALSVLVTVMLAMLYYFKRKRWL